MHQYVGTFDISARCYIIKLNSECQSTWKYHIIPQDLSMIEGKTISDLIDLIQMQNEKQIPSVHDLR